MKDADYITKLEQFVDDVLPQVRSICLQDFGNLNDICIEQRRRKDAPVLLQDCCPEAGLSYGNHHALECGLPTP